jgi:Fur family transcriptional regulator, ferric uptake regulator
MLREAGLRVTDYRLLILGLLATSTEVLDAADICEKLKAEGVDRVTVYRTLGSLVEAGLAHKVDPGDRRFRYGLTDHSRCTHEHHIHDHPHLVCDQCGRVECLEDAEVIIRHHIPAVDAYTLDGGAAPRPANSPRPLIKQQSVTLHGLCSRCNTAS